MKKLTERYIEPYIVEEVVSKNIVKLKLLATMRIYQVVNVSWIMRYREPVEEWKIKEPKLIKVEEWKVEKILNKRIIWGYMKYLVCWKRFIVENGILKKLENIKEAVAEFKRRINTEIRKKKE